MSLHTQGVALPRTSQQDGEVTVLRTLHEGVADEGPSPTVLRALKAPVRVAGGLPFDPLMKAEVIRRARAAGVDAEAVEAWLRPMPERIDAGTPPWPPAFAEIFREVKADYESREPPDMRAARIATTLEGALVTNDESSFTAYFRVPKDTAAIDYPLLMLNNATWLIDVLDEQRRALVAECRKRGRSWADIALALGVTRASAWQRYSSPEE